MVEDEGESEVIKHQSCLKQAEESIAAAEEACNSMLGNHYSAEQVEAYKKQNREKLTKLEKVETDYEIARNRFKRVHWSSSSDKSQERSHLVNFFHPRIHHYEKYVRNIEERYKQDSFLVGGTELLKAKKAYDKLLYLELDIEAGIGMIIIADCVFFGVLILIVGTFYLLEHVQPGKQTSIEDWFLVVATFFAALVSIFRWTENSRAEALDQHTEVEQKLIKRSKYRHMVNFLILITEAVCIVSATDVALLTI